MNFKKNELAQEVLIYINHQVFVCNNPVFFTHKTSEKTCLNILIHPITVITFCGVHVSGPDLVCVCIDQFVDLCLFNQAKRYC